MEILILQLRHSTASKMLIPVFHVEGGIRTHCLDMPEEQNRIIADHLSSMIFVNCGQSKRSSKEGLGIDRF